MSRKNRFLKETFDLTSSRKMISGSGSNFQVSISTYTNSSYTFLTISSQSNISELDWHVNNLVPVKKRVPKEGLVMLIYKREEIKALHLTTQTIQKNYLSNNLVRYLETTETPFGSNEEESFSRPYLPLLGVIGVALVGGYLIHSKNSAREED